MSKTLGAALPIAFIVVYAREHMGTLFEYKTFSLIPPLMWRLLLVPLGGANAGSAFRLVRTERAPPSFLGSHPQGVLPANIPGEPLYCCDDGTTAVFQPRGVSAPISPHHPLRRPVMRPHSRLLVLRVRGDYPRAQRVSPLP